MRGDPEVKRKKQLKAPRTAFSEMDLGLIGIVGLALTIALLAVALNIGKVLDLVGHTSYTAELSEAGGIRGGDEVRVAGIKVGEVKSVKLVDDHVEVSFRLSEVEVGDQTRATVKSDNALGSKFLAIEPGGKGDSDMIPLERTDAGFAVNEELGELTTSTSKIDTDRLAASFDSVSKVLSATPKEFRSALTGVSELSKTLSSRDSELATLLQEASGLSDVLADRNKDITSIFTNGSLLFTELESRRKVIGELLQSVETVSAQLSGFVKDNKVSLRPALTELRQAARLLGDYRSTLDFAIGNTGAYARSLGESVAGGPFFQAYLANVGSPEDLVTGGLAGILQGNQGGF